MFNVTCFIERWLAFLPELDCRKKSIIYKMFFAFCVFMLTGKQFDYF